MRLFRRRTQISSVLREALASNEHVLAAVPTTDGRVIAVSRFGLWQVDDVAAERWDWHHISKARLAEDVLHVTVADEVATWPDGTVALIDRLPLPLPLQHSSKLTDMVHHRVRRSVEASKYVDWIGAGGRVVLRRIAGCDGLTPQIRLDAGANPQAAGFVEAVAAAIDELWPGQVPRPAPPEATAE